MTTIEQVNTALSRYYSFVNQQYNDEFINYCDSNGIDDDMLRDEMTNEGSDSFLVEFDDNFPFYNVPSDKQQFIASVLKHCYANPQVIFSNNPSSHSYLTLLPYPPQTT